MSKGHAGVRRRLTAVGAGALIGLGGLFVPAAMAAEHVSPDSTTPTAQRAPSEVSDSTTFGADASTYLSDATLAASTAEATASNPHCAVSLTPDQEKGASGVAGQRCFTRFADAVAYGTGGEVRLRADAGPEALRMNSKAVKASTLLSIMYNHRGYDGASKVLLGSGRGCYAGRTYSINNLSSVRWNNRTNSVKMRSNCLGRFYAGKNQRGDRYLCVGNCSSLGNMNNRATSTKFF